MSHRLLHRVAGEPRVRAAVEIAAELARDDPPLGVEPVLQIPPLGAAGGADLHLLGPVPGELARPPGQQAGEDRQRFDEAVHLAAEAPAHRAADEVQAVRRQLQQLRGRAQREEQRLRGGVHDDAPVDLGRGDGAVGLDGRLFDRRHLVATLDDLRGAGEGGLDIAEAQLLVVVFLVIDEGVAGIGLVDHGGARPQRLLGIEDVGQRLPVHAHRGAGVAGRAVAVGDDGQHRLADIGDLLLGDQRLVVDPEIDEAQQRVEVARHVGPADDAPHARHPLGAARVDPAHARVMMRAAHAAHMQQPLEGVVVEKPRSAGDMTEDVLPARRLADLVQVLGPLIGEQVLAELQGHQALRRCDAARIASMIGS